MRYEIEFEDLDAEDFGADFDEAGEYGIGEIQDTMLEDNVKGDIFG